MAMAGEPTVFVVDDDVAVRDGLRLLLGTVGLRCESYASAAEFLAAYDPGMAGCLVLDVRMPGMSGLALQEELVVRRITLPVIIMTGHGDVPMAVRAMKTGAMEFIEKPFRKQVLLDAIRAAVDQEARQRTTAKQRAAVAERFARLSQRERTVMARIVAGGSAEQIAAELGISPKTVYIHRGKAIAKMGVHSLAELVRLAALLPDSGHAPEE
jgi:two-component system response regulator FixJ